MVNVSTVNVSTVDGAATLSAWNCAAKVVSNVDWSTMMPDVSAEDAVDAAPSLAAVIV